MLEGVVPQSALDSALTHLFSVQFRLGLFDDPAIVPYTNISVADVCSDAHQALALDAARQGIVLLKNINGTLPLAPAAVKTLAVIGPNGASRRAWEQGRFIVLCVTKCALEGWVCIKARQSGLERGVAYCCGVIEEN